VIYVLYSVHILVCVFLILVVLLQQGKGADLSVFGGGSTQTAFGARGATTLLHKLTVASFVVFILTTLAIGIPQFAGEASVMSGGAVAGTATPGKTGKPAAPGVTGKATPGVPSKQAIPVGVKTAPAPAQPAAPGKPPGGTPSPQQ
jgi:preprotein translocase subunit SecG